MLSGSRRRGCQGAWLKKNNAYVAPCNFFATRTWQRSQMHTQGQGHRPTHLIKHLSLATLDKAGEQSHVPSCGPTSTPHSCLMPCFAIRRSEGGLGVSWREPVADGVEGQTASPCPRWCGTQSPLDTMLASPL